MMCEGVDEVGRRSVRGEERREMREERKRGYVKRSTTQKNYYVTGHL